ncbi:MAG TPA: Maf family nucleotide pyrophosphatase, partial [Pseudobdellovibrionaceae bacterium]|nr:Maf family nucleotide pyrophosphatase [Pseudobdellovibrionaceae bacterium]
MHRLILASASPRRKFLLEKAGFVFSVFPSHVSENPNKNISIDLQILDIAERKARASFDILNSQLEVSRPFVLLAVDTEVVIDKTLVGKPKDREDAARILRLLSGRTHEVKSGVVLLDSKTQKIITQVDTSQIQFKNLSDEDIQSYLDLNEYIDKAGAYAMQGQGQKLVASYQGSWDNIVGLPIQVFKKLILELNIILENQSKSPLEKIQNEFVLKFGENRAPQIIAVSKFQSLEKIKILIDQGQKNFGENYLQEAQVKMQSLSDKKIHWHFIGRIQRNKIKHLVQNFDWIHTLSDLSMAEFMDHHL